MKTWFLRIRFFSSLNPILKPFPASPNSHPKKWMRRLVIMTTQNTPCHQQQKRWVVDFDRKCLSKQHFLIHIDEWTRHTSCRRLWPLATQSTRLETSDNMLSTAPLNTSTSNFMAAARHEMCRQLEIIGSRLTFIQPEKEVKKTKGKEPTRYNINILKKK